MVYGDDVRSWWINEGGKDEIKNGKIAWKGDNEASKQNQCSLRLYSIAWKNPNPDKKVESITFRSRQDADVHAVPGGGERGEVERGLTPASPPFSIKLRWRGAWIR